MNWHKSPAVAVVLLLVVGCLAPVTPIDPVDPVDPITPAPLTPHEASAAFGADLSTRLSVTSAELATRAASGEFASLEALNDEWVDRVAADIAAAKRPVVAAMNDTLLDSTGEQPGDVAADLFRQLATGFAKGSR